jgi:DNA-binding GntR family transcriptional regulator
MELFAFGKEFNAQYSISLVEQIREFLKNSIIEGRLQPGQRLVENELQRKFKVSRAPIRESFRILEKNGLLINIPRKGTYVRKITKKFIEEAFPIRALLEGFASRIAVSHLKIKDIKEMELALSNMTDAVNKNDSKSYLKYHSKFHEIFIKASGNEMLIEMLENLRNQAVWFRYAHLAIPLVEESFKDLILVHREILDSLVKKDEDLVEEQVKNHILSAGQRFFELLALKNENQENYGVGVLK